MGIQGMTNWKFSAFLTIALMLVAGLFSTTAAANDGHGKMTVAVSEGDNFQNQVGTLGDANYRPGILFANEPGYTLTFTYVASKNMQDGKIEITIPGDDWKIPFNTAANSDSIRASQTGVIAENKGLNLYVKGTKNSSKNDSNELIEITKSGDNVTKLVITLKGASWNATADNNETLTLTITTVTSAIPRSLYVPAVGYPYREYTFTTKSMAKGGTLRRLVIPADDPATDPDESDVDPQPKINVGNVKSGKGKITVSPIVYQSETDRNIQLVFEAAGPMYDVPASAGTAIDSKIVITIPGGLGTKPSTGNFPIAPAPQINTANGDEFVSVSRVTGTVQFTNPNQRILPDTAASTVTVDTTRIEYGAKIYVSYRKVDVNPELGNAINFTATAASGTNTGETVTFAPDGTAGKEHVRRIAGSGTITISDGSDDIVAMGSKPDLTFKYTAATTLTDVAMTISQPDEGATGWTDLELVTGAANKYENNYVTTSGGGNVAFTISDDDNINLTGLDLNKGASFTVKIERAQLTNTADPPVAFVADDYQWSATLATGDGNGLTGPTLYIVNVNDDVDFDILNVGNTAVEPLPHYPAAKEQNVRFRFAISTPIKGGGLRFNIPSGWRAPSHTDVKGKARVKLVNPPGATGALVDKYGPDDNVTFTTSGNQISVKIKTLNGTVANPVNVDIQYGAGDYPGMVQVKAQADLEIIGHFSTGVTSTYYPADSPVLMRIGNVEAGSGTAMITSPSSHQVEAGSKKNTIKIQFKAAGTMDGGTVRLGTPLGVG